MLIKGKYEFVENWSSDTLDDGYIEIKKGSTCDVTGWDGDNSYFFEIKLNGKDFYGYIKKKYLRILR